MKNVRKFSVFISSTYEDLKNERQALLEILTMNQEIRNYVMQKMSSFLDSGQTLRLERILEEVQLKQKEW